MKVTRDIEVGPILVCLHGFPNNSTLWARQKAHFAGKASVVTIDMGTESDLDTLTNAVAQEVCELRHEFPSRPIVLLAHDLGCFVMNEVSLRHPDLVDGQILLNGAGIAQFASRATSARQWLRSFYVPLLNLPLVPGVVRWVGGIAFDRTTFDFRPIMLYRQLSRRAVSTLVRRRGAPPCYVPTTLVSSADDPFLVVPSGKEICRFFSNAAHRLIPGGHWSPVVQAVRVNQIIADQLELVERAV